MDSPEHDFVVLDDTDVVGTDATGILPQSPEQIQEIREWLRPTDYSASSSEYKRHLATYVPGTGNWMQEPQYQQWMDSKDYGTLWIKAISGAGKSVVAAHLTSELGKSNNIPVLYFFFREIITTNRTPNSLMRDWMSQILCYSPSLQFKLRDYLDRRRSLDSIAFDELWHELCVALSDMPRVYCVADALDEMSLGNDCFIQQLAELGQSKPRTIKVFMTSRPVPRIERLFRNQPILHITLSQRLVDSEIAVYIKYRLAATSLPTEIRQEAKQSLMRKSQGLFLYTKLMIDDILASQGLTEPDSFRNALDKLPDGSAEMYTRVLHDHSVRSGVPRSLQLTILQWVTHSSRPLRLLEIATMIDSLPKQPDLNSDVGSLGDSPNTKSVIRTACGPLIEILADEPVSIIHHSFTEYLINPERGVSCHSDYTFPSITPAKSHRDLAFACINYLISGWADNFELEKNKTPVFFRSTLPSNIITTYAKNPFLKYAGSSWSYHASRVDQPDEELFNLLDRLFNLDSNAFASWLGLEEVRVGNTDTSALHFASGEGLALYVEHLIQMDRDVNALDCKNRTPVHRAVAKGHSDVVRVLLDHGANPDPDDDCGLKPLHLAASGNHASVVKLLLESGVDAKTIKTKQDRGRRCGKALVTRGNTAIMYAFKYGHTEAALAFFPYLKSEDLSQALSWAAEAGKTEIVLAVQDTGRIEVNKMTNGKTLVYLAAYKHDLHSLRILLRLKADINIRCDNVWGRSRIRCIRADDVLKSTPLHEFTRGCHVAEDSFNNEKSRNFITLLLESGSDVNAVDASGKTALHLAVTGDRHRKSADASIVAELLKNGANASATTDDGCQPLHLARADSSVVRNLVDHGAGVNAPNSNTGQTPLHYSVEDFYDDKFLALIERGANCSVQDKNGNTPLHVALQGFSYSKVKIGILLNNGADPNIKNNKGETPLHGMKEWNGLHEILPLLVGAGANLELRTPTGKTVLMQILSGWQARSSPDLLSLLLGAGARLDSRDYDGRTFLHQLGEDAQSAIMIRSLVKAGADARAVDFAGNTLLHYVARQPSDYHSKEQMKLLELTLELGIDTNSRNNLGQTPFHIAAGTRDQPCYKTGLFDFLLGSKCNSDVNVADNKKNSPYSSCCNALRASSPTITERRSRSVRVDHRRTVRATCGLSS